MPNPTPEQLASPAFKALWQAVKTWDVNVPEFYAGYCGASGSHVALLLNALAAAGLVVVPRTTERLMVNGLRTYAIQGRDSHKTLAFFGNDAREALAAHLGVDVAELEPGTPRALELLKGL